MRLVAGCGDVAGSRRHDLGGGVQEGLQRPGRYAEEGAHRQAPDERGGDERAVWPRAARGGRGAEQEVAAVRHHRGEDDRHAHQGDRGRPAEADGELGAEHVRARWRTG